MTAVRARMVGDSGAYASVGGQGAGARRRACLRAVSRAQRGRRITSPPTPTIRPAARCAASARTRRHFAMEGCLDLLADKAGLDGWEMRWRNAVDVGDTFSTGQVFEKSVGIRKTLARGEGRLLRRLPNEGRAVGIGLRHQEQRHRQRRDGMGQSAPRRRAGRHDLALQRLHRDGPGASDRAGAVRGRSDRSAGLACSVRKWTPPTSCSAGRPPGSRATLFGGRAVIMAAEKLKADLDSQGSAGRL